MNYWLMKSEPTCYSIDTLKRDKVTAWDGIRNYRVRNILRDDMKVGDLALFYHSSSGTETGIAGEMKIISKAQIDETQFDPKNEHYDPKSEKTNPRWFSRNVRFISKLHRVVTLDEIKTLKEFKDSLLIQKGNRLSVMLMTKAQYNKVVTMSRKPSVIS